MAHAPHEDAGAEPRARLLPYRLLALSVLLWSGNLVVGRAGLAISPLGERLASYHRRRALVLTGILLAGGKT